MRARRRRKRTSSSGDSVGVDGGSFPRPGVLHQYKLSKRRLQASHVAVQGLRSGHVRTLDQNAPKSRTVALHCPRLLALRQAVSGASDVIHRAELTLQVCTELPPTQEPHLSRRIAATQPHRRIICQQQSGKLHLTPGVTQPSEVEVQLTLVNECVHHCTVSLPAKRSWLFQLDTVG